MSTNLVQSWASNVRGAEYGFFKAVIYALEQFKEKNNLPLTALVAICNGKSFGTYKIIEGDRLAYATPLKRILDKVLDNCTLKFEGGKAKWKVGGNGGVNSEQLEGLRILVAGHANMTIRSEAFKTAYPAVKKAVDPNKTVDIAKVKESAEDHFVKYLKERGLKLEDIAQGILAKMSANVVEV